MATNMETSEEPSLINASNRDLQLPNQIAASQAMAQTDTTACAISKATLQHVASDCL